MFIAFVDVKTCEVTRAEDDPTRSELGNPATATEDGNRVCERWCENISTGRRVARDGKGPYVYFCERSP